MKVIYIIVCLLVAVCAFGQHPLDHDEWEERASELDYTENAQKTKTDYMTDEEVVEESPSSSSHTSSPDSGGSSSETMSYVLMVVLGVLLIGFIASMLFGSKQNVTVNQTINPSFSAEEFQQIEEQLDETNLDDLLKNAFQNKNYTAALRLSFLTIIKELAAQKHIEWRKEKTNWDYHDEIADEQLRQQYSKATMLFEQLWYGDRHIGEAEFTAINEDFEELKNKMQVVEEA